MNSHHWIPNQFFGSEIFCSNEFAEFEKNLQKIFAFFFESNETTLFSSNDILDCFPYLEGIPRDLPRDIPRVLIFYIFFLKVFIYNFFTRKFDILKIIFIKFLQYQASGVFKTHSILSVLVAMKLDHATISSNAPIESLKWKLFTK